MVKPFNLLGFKLDLHRFFIFVAVMLAFNISLMLKDIITDSYYTQMISIDHIATEISIVAVSLITLLALVKMTKSKNFLIRTNISTNEQIISNEQGDFESHVQSQFNAWNFTPAEAAIGMLLINGLSTKEIAEVRGTSEKTIRVQTVGIYKKAGISGRNELSAHFLKKNRF